MCVLVYVQPFMYFMYVYIHPQCMYTTHADCQLLGSGNLCMILRDVAKLPFTLLANLHCSQDEEILFLHTVVNTACIQSFIFAYLLGDKWYLI